MHGLAGRNVRILRPLSYITLAATFFAVAVAALVSVGNVAAQNGDWELVRAEYGIRGRRVDVTNVVRRLLWQGRDNGRAPVNNQTMGGDPAVGADKTLHIVAQNRRGEQRDFEYREGMWIDITVFALRPEHHDDDRRWDDRRRDDDHRDDAHRDDTVYRDPDWDREHRRDDGDRGRFRRLEITKAYYGAQGQMVNVTDMVRGMVRDGRFVINVNNASLGGDPAIGRDKVLIVLYVADGKEQAMSTHEGNTMQLP